MSAFVKAYPRAKVSRHPKINGWVIDLFHREGARPQRVSATYATVGFAARAARLKLGLTPPPPLLEPRPAAEVLQLTAPAPVVRTRAANGERSTGTCTPCGRPMRPAGSKATDYPGTTLRQRDGICQTCYQKAKRLGAAA
ncbi:hypothetical protein QFZ79_002928 [Arthrobacter sp. V4I6]|uniref:hypothetical protein n=1 Tax=Arthrobacter sp. V4I6 TaxID=3042281 RepID=UPI00277D3E32|nr:hypothetical protein [Arthrobacter sp. V4I6]MDQ0854817.1 hypothetical protein [Arthrobacter sp. V4I6]